MSDLQSLDEQIQQRLKAVEAKARSQRDHLQAKMVEIEKRHSQFDDLADELVAAIVEPRMKKLADSFGNAELLERNQASKHNCVCRFNHSAKYPASVKLTLAVAHDEEIKDILLVYDLEILPIFFKFEGHSQVAIPLEGQNQQTVVDWVDERILAFVDTYLRLAQTDQYQQDNLVTDPVCGMRFQKNIASAVSEHAGNTYFFCSSGCHEQFMGDPNRYVSS